MQMLFWNRWNQELAGRVYFYNISREKPTHTPHVQPLSCKLEWTNQEHLIIVFLLKPIRDNLAPGFPRALDLSPLQMQKIGYLVCRGWHVIAYLSSALLIFVDHCCSQTMISAGFVPTPPTPQLVSIGCGKYSPELFQCDSARWLSPRQCSPFWLQVLPPLRHLLPSSSCQQV